MSDDPRPDLPTDAVLDELCGRLATVVVKRGLSVSTAESLTVGNIAAHLGKAPDAGSWFRGGIIAYSREVKHSVLHVPDGPVVSEEAARVMAHSTATLMGSTLTLAVTGEAGPQTQEDVPPGTVWFGIVDHGRAETEKQVFAGEPEDILAATIEHAINLLLRHAVADTASVSSKDTS
ncbi:CinA family protein [Rhodococcus erythropolis]|uniref:CinA family protein n=1 Tax=Rhodococcus erythropolis TaxID=1833 RepID=UPI001BE6807F|nr:CinA family protein [Rhodococcus erythropolis]MBT2264349.1 CinA family protein [Rhodococcus erythropolis]